MTRLARLLRERDDERGFALVAVVGVAAVVMILVATMLSVSTSGARVTSNDTDWARAADAAYAGVADYQSHLNADNTYGQYGQADATFSKATGSTFAKGLDTNPAFDIKPVAAGGRWVTVPTVGGAAGPSSFRYAVDNSKLASQGVIRVQSTGRAGKVTRTVVANVRPDGFSNYLYFTNYESGDPTVTNETAGRSGASCTSDYRVAARTSSCQQIQFGPNDLLQGPVRTNDQLKICGSTFQSTVQTVGGWNSADCGTAAPSFASAPTTASTLTPPSTIGDLRDSMRSDLQTTTDSVEGTGCLFTGPTKITFNGDGTMTVVSPLTIATNVEGATAVPGAPITKGSAPAKCGDVDALHSSGGATIPIPKNNLVYVQNEPAARPSGTTPDPNYWDASPKYKNIANACDATSYANSWTRLKSNGVGFPYSTNSPTTSEVEPVNGNNANVSTPYGCDRGDAFVKGVVDKAVTVAAENYLYVTGDVTYPATRAASTVLGLIGQRAVWVWNPINTYGNTLTGQDREIDAAILSNQGTFVVQNWTQGSTRGRGALTIKGSVAQNFRGAVGLASGQGYDKNYKYDASLATYTPPKFPQPTVTTYRVATQVESKTAYTADGAAIP